MAVQLASVSVELMVESMDLQKAVMRADQSDLSWAAATVGLWVNRMVEPMVGWLEP